jgi:hypothetical protein
VKLEMNSKVLQNLFSCFIVLAVELINFGKRLLLVSLKIQLMLQQLINL